MIFKRNRSVIHRGAGRAEGRLSPRHVALVHEAWWLVVVALLAFLALILATYHKTDAAWSYSGRGGPIQNKGGVVGAWLSDLLLYLFGLSAWWWVVAGVVLVIIGYRSMMAHQRADADGERGHSIWLALPGFAVLLLASAALEALRLYHLPVGLPLAPGGAIGELIGNALAKA